LEGKAPERGSKGEAPERGSKGEAPERGSKGEVPERGSKGEALEHGSKGEAPKRGLKGEAPERGSKGEAPERESKGEAPERGSKGEAPERGSKGEAPERAYTQMSTRKMRNLNFIAWCQRHNVGHGLLPTLDYIVEGMGEKALCAKDRSGAVVRRSTGSLRLSQFWGCVVDMPLWDDLVDKIWAFPWQLQLRCACLLEAKHEVARLKGASADPSAVVVAEALLIDR
jgi:hypothetical protein